MKCRRKDHLGVSFIMNVKTGSFVLLALMNVEQEEKQAVKVCSGLFQHSAKVTVFYPVLGKFCIVIANCYINLNIVLPFYASCEHGG